MSWLTSLFDKVKAEFNPAKIKVVETDIESLMPYAMDIVGDIAKLAPNKTLTEINTIATKYALPAVTELASGQTAGNVLLNMGTAILAKNNAPAAATSLLNTVVQLAVTATNSQG